MRFLGARKYTLYKNSEKNLCEGVFSMRLFKTSICFYVYVIEIIDFHSSNMVKFIR